MKMYKHIGIVGVTAEGASLCYRTIVTEAAKMLGPNKHPEITLHNYSLEEIAAVQMKKDWDDYDRWFIRETPSGTGYKGCYS